MVDSDLLSCKHSLNIAITPGYQYLLHTALAESMNIVYST
jgi:hypothetical protein